MSSNTAGADGLMDQQKTMCTFLFLNSISRFVKLTGPSMGLLSEKYVQGTFHCGRATNTLHTGLGSFCVVGAVTHSSY